MTDRNHTQTEFTQYRRTQIAEMADWVPGFDMDRVSVSDADKEGGSPKIGDKIARNPANHADRWLVAADYFAVNFEPIDRLRTPAQEPREHFSVFSGFGERKNILEAEMWCPNCKDHMDISFQSLGKSEHFDKTGQYYYDAVCQKCAFICTSLLVRECHPPLAVQGGITEGPEVKRYHIRVVGESSRGFKVEHAMNAAGEYVLYEDHIACVRALSRLSPATTATGGGDVPKKPKCSPLEYAISDIENMEGMAEDPHGTPHLHELRSASVVLEAFKSARNFLQRLATSQTQIVSSASCSGLEIAQAAACGRMYVDDQALGYILRPPPAPSHPRGEGV